MRVAKIERLFPRGNKHLIAKLHEALTGLLPVIAPSRLD